MFRTWQISTLYRGLRYIEVVKTSKEKKEEEIRTSEKLTVYRVLGYIKGRYIERPYIEVWLFSRVKLKKSNFIVYSHLATIPSQPHAIYLPKLQICSFHFYMPGQGYPKVINGHAKVINGHAKVISRLSKVMPRLFHGYPRSCQYIPRSSQGYPKAMPRLIIGIVWYVKSIRLYRVRRMRRSRRRIKYQSETNDQVK